jgi:hypothetical protein
VFHTRLRILLVPKGLILVRTQNLLVIACSVSFDKIRLAFLDPLRQPPQGAEVCLHNDGGDVGGLLQDRERPEKTRRRRKQAQHRREPGDSTKSPEPLSCF